MNRKLGHFIKAALFALPLALPSVALAQSAGTMDNTDKQNDRSQDTSDTSKSDLDRNPPAGSLGTSGPSSSSDRSVGGDINKPSDDTATMNSASTKTTKHKTIKKTVKRTTTSDFNNDSNR